MRAAGTGFCSVAARTADCVFVVEVSLAFKALIVSSSLRFPLIVSSSLRFPLIVSSPLRFPLLLRL